jgi:hypothetical protein
MMCGSGRRRVNRHPGEAGGEILHNTEAEVRGGFKKTSVADPGYLSRIPDPKTATKERGEKFFLSYLFL